MSDPEPESPDEKKWRLLHEFDENPSSPKWAFINPFEILQPWRQPLRLILAVVLGSVCCSLIRTLLQ